MGVRRIQPKTVRNAAPEKAKLVPGKAVAFTIAEETVELITTAQAKILSEKTA